MSTHVSKIVRSKALQATLVAIAIGSASPAHAGLFGHSKAWKEAQAAAAAQAQADADAAAQRQAQELANERAQEAAAYAAQQAAYAAQQQAALRAQQQAQAPVYQAPAPYAPAAAPVVATGGATLLDKSGNPLPLDANGRPIGMKASQAQLWDYQHQDPTGQIRAQMKITVTQDTWTPEIEDKYSAFVQKFGAGVRGTPEKLLNYYMHDPNTNMYAAQDPAGLKFYSDCADLPYFLRSYFAYHNGLPMSVVTGLKTNPHPVASLPTPDGDITAQDQTKLDVSPYGNIITARGASNVARAPGRERNYLDWWQNLMDAGSTRTFRIGPLNPNYAMSDVYPVKADRNGIRPGSLIHTNGHILVVTNVTPEGFVQLIDAHPDNSLQYKTLDPSKLDRGRPDLGFGFYRFRPIKAVGGQWLPSGNGTNALYGAQVMTESDSQLFQAGQWSMEQWFGPGSQVAPATTSIDPTLYKQAFGSEFFDWLRGQLATVVLTPDVIARVYSQALCDDLRQRVPDVQLPLTSHIQMQPHPDTIPSNIFSASGDWEMYATPSRDGRARQEILNLPNVIAKQYRFGAQNKYKIALNGMTPAQFGQAIVANLNALDQSCRATYTKSDGTHVTMNFSDLVRRAPLMSMDDSDCAEKRWGAQGAEMASCKDSDPTNAWYNAEQSIRNTAGKNDDAGIQIVRSNRDITLQMLQSGQYVDQPDSAPVNLGYSKSRQPDLRAYFTSPQFIQNLNH